LYFQAVPANGLLLDVGVAHEEILYRLVEHDVLDAKSVEDACASLWFKHNEDGRPRNSEIRSMSTLDVLALHGENGEMSVRVLTSNGALPVEDSALVKAFTDPERETVVVAGRPDEGRLSEGSGARDFAARHPLVAPLLS
jgi:hypothetical protein